MLAWVTLMPNVSARRRYVRFGFGRNNYCDCSDCVARPSRVIRLGVQSSWSGVGPVAVPRSSVCVDVYKRQGMGLVGTVIVIVLIVWLIRRA